MTKLVVTAVRDAAMAMFHRPMFTPTVAVAVRAVADEANRKVGENPLSAHPEDYELFELGFYDEDSGLFETGVPKSVCQVKNLIRG